MKTDLSEINILYVDSNEDAKEYMTEFFKFFQSVDFCNDAETALIHFTSKLYDIVITDIEQPAMDGLSLSKEIRIINPEQAIIIVTINSSIKSFLYSIEMGIDSYILKPFKEDEIFKAITNVAQKTLIKKEIKEHNESLEFLLKEKSEELIHAMAHDHLTGLYNHFAFLQKVKENTHSSVLLLNIDHFSNINDAYGFEIGDEVLIHISEYLKIITPFEFTLYRLESDEFLMLSEDRVENQKLIELAESIISFFTQSEVSLDDGIDLKISFSIGITVGYGMDTLNQAKIAIKELREHRRGYYKLYDSRSEYLHKQNDNIYWIHRIRDAVNNDNLTPYFQPLINNKTKKIEKYECLARIEEDGEVISPALFMKAAELTGTLHFITKSVIEQSFKVFSSTDFEFSINITSDDLYLDYLEDFLLKYSKKYSIEPSRVVLEILEDITSLNEFNILTQLNSLREHGFKIAIDDFGSESSNFSRLVEFSPDYLKIDGSFIKNIVTDKKSQIITEAIVLICKKSNIKVIAEYVHNREVLDKINELGIEYSQGYYFSAPKKEL